jgi:hemin uptake protein HemP
MHDAQLSSNRIPVPTAAPARELKRVSTDDLIGPAREVLIRHAGCDYRLRITRQGKLILTK